MPKVAARAAPIPELLRELAKRDAGTAAELSSDAMKRGLELVGHGDDSDGRLGDILSEIAAVHRETFGRAGLAPRILARNLFEPQLADGYNFFVLEDYLSALGKEGYAAYREIAAEAWKRVPVLAPGSREDRHEEALKWAEEGHRVFAQRPESGLDDFVVAEYHKRGRHEDAIALRWSRFAKSPHLRGYQALKEDAERSQSWSTWRENALAAVRKAQKNRKPPVPGVPYWMPGGASLLVEIFLWEGDPVAALREARAGGCTAHLWLQLAGALESDHPDQAVAIYQERIDPIVNLANNQAYDQAADLLRRIRGLMARTGKNAGFAPYLGTLRIKHKAKRNFMQRLETVATEKARAGSNRTR